MSYLFGGNTRIKSAADLDRERLLVEALMGPRKAPSNLGEGLNALGEALGYRLAKRRLDKDTGVASEAGNKLFASLFGGRQDTAPDTAPTYATDTTAPAAEPNLPAVTAELGYSPDTPAIDPTRAQAIPQPNAAPQQLAQNAPVHPLPGTPEFQDLISKYELVLGDPSFQNLDPARQKIANDRYQNLLKQQDEATDPYKQQLLKNSQLEYEQKLHPDQVPLTELQKAQVEKLTTPDTSLQDEATSIADAIIRGDQPPDLTGLYRQGSHVRAALANKGYNLTKAKEDWMGQSKLIATMNGPQQTRLRQAVEFTYHSLPIIEGLAKEWKGSNYPTLNRASLLAAKEGGMGPKAQIIATKLEAQIADLTSELGTVYKGGNSSTDESLRLAGENLKSNWSEATLLANIAQVKQNLDIRRNSLALAPQGVGGQYSQMPVAPQPAAGQGGKPADWTQEEWDALTPEEKAQFGQ